jgi:hypothetical protein
MDGKSLVLVQVNCRSILNKYLDFGKLTHIIPMSSVRDHDLERTSAMPKYLGTVAQLSEGTGTPEAVQCSLRKKYLACVMESWPDEDSETIVVAAKGRDAKFTREMTDIGRAPNEDMQVIERLATPTDSLGKSKNRRTIGGD